jgi:hypothetical protein
MTDTEIELLPAPLTGHCVKCEQGPVPRGSWSRFHCVECDIDRMTQFDAAHSIAIGDPDKKPLGREHFEAESAKLRLERGWS